MRHTNLLLIYMIYPPGRCNMHTLESSVGMITDGIFCRRFDSGKVYSNSHGNEYGSHKSYAYTLYTYYKYDFQVCNTLVLKQNKQNKVCT